MNVLNPNEFHTTRQSGNDHLTAADSNDGGCLTRAKARLAANEIRRHGVVEDAEAVHVSHRNGYIERYQVNVLLDSDTASPRLLDEIEADHDVQFRAPQAYGGRLVLQFTVPEVEVVEQGAYDPAAEAEEDDSPGLGELFG